jgi:tetratricopeptide (TPR) repeat protein
VALSTADAENALNMFMRVLEWFFCESEHGPQLSGIYTATQPQPLTPEHATALPTRQAGFGSLLRGLLQWRKLLLSLSAIALLGLAMSMLLPYVSVLRAHRLWQQASHEDEIKQAGEAYQAALEKLRGRFWNTQRAVMLNRLGRIYAARRFAGYALHFYSEAIKENPNLAAAYTNKAFLLEEGAEKEAYLSAKTDKFDEALGLYQQARQKDPADRFARALQEGVLRRQQTALSRAQVEELLARPQQCSGLPNAADGTPLTIALHMAAPRHDSFAQRAGEGEVLVQRLVQTFRENQRLVVQEHALEDECFVVRLLAVYSILRSATDALHKSTLWVQVLATDTAKIQADAQVEWTHEQLDGVAEQLASTLWQRLQSKTSHPGSG